MSPSTKTFPWSAETPFPMVGRGSLPTERSARLLVTRTGGESSGDDVSRCLSGSCGKCVATCVPLSGCRQATSGRAGCLSSITGDVSPRLGNVGFGRTGTDRKSGIDLRSVGRRCRVLMSGQKSGVDFRYGCSRCRVLMSGVDVGRRCRMSTSGDDVGRPTWCQTRCRCRDLRRKSAPGKCFRYGLATQDLVSRDVHGLITTIAIGNALFLLYLSSGGRRGRIVCRRQERREAELSPV